MPKIGELLPALAVPMNCGGENLLKRCGKNIMLSVSVFVLFCYDFDGLGNSRSGCFVVGLENPSPDSQQTRDRADNGDAERGIANVNEKRFHCIYFPFSIFCFCCLFANCPR